LLLNGSQINVTNDDGNTPLHCAISADDPKLVALLLKYHADPHIKNKKGQTPGDIARSLKFTDVQELLEMSDELQGVSNTSNPTESVDTTTSNDDDETDIRITESEQSSSAPRVSVTTAKILNQITRSDPFRAKKLLKQNTKKKCCKTWSTLQKPKKNYHC